jgi:hypothetical protein
LKGCQWTALPACIFTARDPFPSLTRLPVTLQPYLYAAGNPLHYTDPSGRFIFLPLLAVAAAGGLLGGIGYYALQTNFNHDPCARWEWKDAVFWGGVGTGLGALFGSGIALWMSATAATTVATVGGAAAKTASSLVADSDPTNEFTILYRFADSAADLMSRASRLPEPLKSQIQAQVSSMSQSELMIRAEQHAMGFVENSPFISTLSDPNAGAATTDPWLRAIISGAQNLYTLSVPSNILYYPSNALSQMEPEVLVLVDTLVPYVTEVFKNPFLR